MEKLNTHQNIQLIFGLKLRQLRQDRNLSFADLSKKSGISTSYLNEIEKGKKYPKLDKMLKLAKALEISYEELVSVQLNHQLAPLSELINSNVLQNLPLELFGLSTSKLVSLISNAPIKVTAFLSTLIRVARSYDMSKERFFFSSLRAYQEMHHNYFEEIEDKVDEFIDQYEVNVAPPVEAQALKNILIKEFGYTINDQQLAEYPDLLEFRCIFIPEKKKLLINPALSDSQQTFLLGKELAFNYLKLKERPNRFSLFNVESFEQALNNFKASYFSVALLMNRHLFLADLRRDLQFKEWHEEKFVALLYKYRATPEMFLHRLTNLLPQYFGIQNLYFLRFNNVMDSNEYFITKELNLGGENKPYTTERGHYCRRWVSIKNLKRLEKTIKEKSPPNTPTIAVQRDHYVNSGAEYLTISIARRKSPTPNENVSVTLGLRLDENVKKHLKFWNDSSIHIESVNKACERCPLEDCAERAAPPTFIEEKKFQDRMESALEKLKEQERKSP